MWKPWCHLKEEVVVEDVISGCLKSLSRRRLIGLSWNEPFSGGHVTSFQLDQQVDISLYITEATALRHSREFSWFDTIVFTFSSISFLAFWTLKSISLHFTSCTFPRSQGVLQSSLSRSPGVVPFDNFVLPKVQSSSCSSCSQLARPPHRRARSLDLCARLSHIPIVILGLLSVY